MRGSRGTLDPAAHPQADPEVRDTQRAKNKRSIKTSWQDAPLLLIALFSFLSSLSPKSAGTSPKKKGRRGHGGQRRGGVGEWSDGAGPLADPPPHLSLSPCTKINNQLWLFIPLRGQQRYNPSVPRYARFHGTTLMLALLLGFWRGAGAFPRSP